MVVARPAYSKVLVGEDEMGSEFLVEAANLKPSADAQMGMDQRFYDPKNSDQDLSLHIFNHLSALDTPCHHKITALTFVIAFY